MPTREAQSDAIDEPWIPHRVRRPWCRTSLGNFPPHDPRLELVPASVACLLSTASATFLGSRLRSALGTGPGGCPTEARASGNLLRTGGRSGASVFTVVE